MNKFIKIQEQNNLKEIAESYGYVWTRIKEHPNNEALFEKYPDHLRMPKGSQLYLPKRETKSEKVELFKTNVFVLKRDKNYFSVILCWPDKKTISGRPYQLNLDDLTIEGETKSDGLVEHLLPTTLPEKVTLCVWPHEEHPDEVMEWTFEFNKYQCQAEPEGNQNYLTLHRHTVLAPEHISKEIEKEATDNVEANKKKNTYSEQTNITSTRNLFPQLFQEAVALLKCKHIIRVTEILSQSYQDKDDLTAQQYIDRSRDFYQIKSTAHKYALLEQSLHAQFIELEKQAKENKLIKQEVSLKAYQDNFFNRLTVCDEILSSIESIKEIEQFEYEYTPPLNLFNQGLLQTDNQCYAQSEKAYKLVHQYHSREVKFVYQDTPDTPIANGVIIYWMYASDNINLATDNQEQYKALNVMMPIGMGYTDDNGKLSQSIPHISPVFSSASWQGQQRNEIYADLERHKLIFENKALYQLDWSIKQAIKLGEEPDDYKEVNKRRAVTQDLKKSSESYKFWPAQLEVSNFQHWEMQYERMSKNYKDAHLKQSLHRVMENERSAINENIVEEMNFDVPFTQLDTDNMLDIRAKLSEKEQRQLEDYTKKTTNKLFYTGQKYGFIVLPPNALNFRTKDLLKLAEEQINETVKVAWSGPLSKTMEENKDSFSAIQLYCTLPEWNRRITTVMKQLDEQLEKKSILMAPHINCASSLDMISDFADLSGNYIFDKEDEWSDKKQAFAKEAKAFNHDIFEALKDGKFTDTKEDEKTEELAKELSSLLDNAAYLIELKRYLKYLDKCTEDEFLKMENTSLYFEEDDGFLMPFNVIQEAYSLLSQTQHGMSELFWEGHIKPAFEAMSEHPKVTEYFDEFDDKDIDRDMVFNKELYHPSTLTRIKNIKLDLTNNAEQRAQEAKSPLSSIIDWYNSPDNGLLRATEIVKNHFMTAPGPPPTAIMILTQWGPKYFTHLLKNPNSSHMKLFLGLMTMGGFLNSKEDVIKYMQVLSDKSKKLENIGDYIRNTATKKDKIAQNLDKRYHKTYRWVQDSNESNTEDVFAGKKATYFRLVVQTVTIVTTIESILTLDDKYKKLKKEATSDEIDINLMVQTLSEGATIFVGAGLAYHTTQLALHRLGVHSGIELFESNFKKSDQAVAKIASRAEFLAFLSMVLSTVQSVTILYDDYHHGGDNDTFNEKNLTAIRDLVINSVTLSGYIMRAVGSWSSVQGMAWVSIVGSRLLAIGIIGGLFVYLAWEASFGLGRKIKSANHRMADFMKKEIIGIEHYFETHKDGYSGITDNQVYQQLKDQADLDVIDWVNYAAFDSTTNIPWGNLSWRAVIPAFEMGLALEDIKKMVSFPDEASKPIYGFGDAKTHQKLTNLIEQSTTDVEKSYYRQVRHNFVYPMTVEGIILYYQRLIYHEKQDEEVVSGLTYAELTDQLRQGIFTPNATDQGAVYDANKSGVQTDASVRLLNYDWLKVKKEENDIVTYELKFIEIDGLLLSWDHPMFAVS